MDRYDVIIVGGGVMGCATAYHLAKRGRRVLLLEQFAIGHALGSSHGHSRIIRLAYDAPDYVRLAQAAYPLWLALEQDVGAVDADGDEPLLLPTGGLDFARRGTPSFEAIGDTLAAMAVPFERLDRAGIARRFPQFQLPDDIAGIYQPDAGILNADRCVATLAAGARRHGAALRQGEAARRIEAVGAGVEVRTDVATYGAERLVVTAGAWARPLLRQAGLDLPLMVTREQVAFFSPRDAALFAPGRFPIFIHHVAGAPSPYGFPIFGLRGVKVAYHRAGPRIEPESDERAVDPAQIEALRAYVAGWVPQAAGEIIFAQTCRYTITPDEHFIVDRHPEHPQIVIGSPCSGHGFKFGVLIGAILADLAERGATKHPIGMFGLQRFAQ